MTVSELIGEALWEKFHRIPGCSVKVDLRPVTDVYNCSLLFNGSAARVVIHFEMRFPAQLFQPSPRPADIERVCYVFEMLIKRDYPALLLACPPGP